MHVVLHIGHRVREHAHVQWVALLATDLVPDLAEQMANNVTLALVMVQLRCLTEAGEC